MNGSTGAPALSFCGPGGSSAGTTGWAAVGAAARAAASASLSFETGSGVGSAGTIG